MLRVGDMISRADVVEGGTMTDRVVLRLTCWMTDHTRCFSSSTFPIAPDMDLIEVLWKQDVDLGFSLDLFNPPKPEGEGKPLPVEEDEVEKLKALEALKKEPPADSTKNEEETADDQWAGLSYTIDLETESCHGETKVHMMKWEDVKQLVGVGFLCWLVCLVGTARLAWTRIIACHAGHTRLRRILTANYH
ncbi:hypothetical protein C0J52_14081 [Blattella germanica]|nr:hypothetical protein C0J52_14081 [Blattella germanica]